MCALMRACERSTVCDVYVGGFLVAVGYVVAPHIPSCGEAPSKFGP